ncbi:MAG: hypothetical protein EKK36_14165 [Bradyrhizobiaceae bacterium]|nr:MAG: hypothetical protein EKK36_14165 [Bradyrhizobiaceae bacterium]
MAFNQPTVRKSRLLSFAALASIFSLSVSSSQAGWFSSDKYDCENKAVITKVQEMIACKIVLQCAPLGLSYTQLTTMTKEQVTAKFEALVEPEVAAAAQRVTTGVNLPILRKGIRRILDNERDVFLTYQTLFQNVTVLTDDYKDTISRYRCHMTYTYDPKVYVPLWTVLLAIQLGSDQLTSTVAEEMDKKNPGMDYIGGLVSAAIQQQNIVGKSRSPETKTAIFTVQPTKDDFVVEIKNTDRLLPGL